MAQSFSSWRAPSFVPSMKENGDLPVMKYSPLPLTIVPLQNVIGYPAELNLRDKANFNDKAHYPSEPY